MNTDKFVRKPFYVEAVRVTDANLEEVAKWCKGDVFEEEGRRYIKVDVHMPMNESQTKAFSGDWVLYANKGHKVYKNKSFWASFDKVEQASEDMLNKLAEKTNGDRHSKAKTGVNPSLLKQQHDAKLANDAKAHKLSRSAKSGEFVSKEEADANPDTTVTETVRSTPVFADEKRPEGYEPGDLVDVVQTVELDTPIPDVDNQVIEGEIPADASLA